MRIACATAPPTARTAFERLLQMLPATGDDPHLASPADELSGEVEAGGSGGADDGGALGVEDHRSILPSVQADAGDAVSAADSLTSLARTPYWWWPMHGASASATGRSRCCTGDHPRRPFDPGPRPWEATRDGDRAEGKPDHPPGTPRPSEGRRQTGPDRGRRAPSPPPLTTAGAMTADHRDTDPRPLTGADHDPST